LHKSLQAPPQAHNKTWLQVRQKEGTWRLAKKNEVIRYRKQHNEKETLAKFPEI